LFWEQAGGRLEDFRRSNPVFEKTPAEILADHKYQVLRSSGPLSIDRVTQDGPRDLIGELKETLGSGPIYDVSKNPGATHTTEIESAYFEGREVGQPDVGPKNLVDKYLQQVDGLRGHLEENYDYAKQIELAIDASRKKMASKILTMKTELSKV